MPETGGQTDPSRPFVKASEVGSYTEYGAKEPTYPVYDEAKGTLENTVQTFRDGVKGSLDLLTGMEDDIMTPITMVRTNPENRVHIAALINVVSAKQAELKQTFQEEELTADPADVKLIQQELTEAARMRSVLEAHMATLAAEASGEKELENISRYRGKNSDTIRLTNFTPYPRQ